jgi:hypothetical protein
MNLHFDIQDNRIIDYKLVTRCNLAAMHGPVLLNFKFSTVIILHHKLCQMLQKYRPADDELRSASEVPGPFQI